MIRFQPYEQYDVQAIETWLNGIAERGYKLTEFGAFFCKFKPDDGVRHYYRARYIPANKEINGAFFWGDLYIYHATDPNLLPAPNYDEESVLAAREQGKPSRLIISVLVTYHMIQDVLPNSEYLTMGEYLLYAACILAVLLWVIYLFSNLIRWQRANRIAEKVLIPSEQPPKAYTKIMTNLSLIPAVIIAVLAVIANI